MLLERTDNEFESTRFGGGDDVLHVCFVSTSVEYYVRV